MISKEQWSERFVEIISSAVVVSTGILLMTGAAPLIIGLLWLLEIVGEDLLHTG
jgi:membrane-bound ClpP family serine protease